MRLPKKITTPLFWNQLFKYPFFLLILLLSLESYAQVFERKSKDNNDLKLSTLPYYSFGKGIGITSPDSLYQLNIRFRMQSRLSYLENEDGSSGYDAQIRRLRLRFDGYIGSPKILYAIQLSFAPGDVGEIVEGENLNIIRDAVVMYRPNKNWNFSFGQTKLPGNRQRVNSSGALQLTDRTINNAKFTIDRDFGFQIHNINEYEDRFSYNFKGAISTGEGRNVTNKVDKGIALTGKVELFPFGSFSRDGTTFEGDLMREKKPKLLLSGAFQQNNNGQRTQGQLGSDLYEKRTMQSVLLDMMFKYNGWAAMSSYMSRTSSKNAITINPLDASQKKYVFVGHGFDYQLSYCFPSNYEVIGRYSTQNVGKDITSLTPNTKELSFGVTKYFWQHTFKLQSEINYDTLTFFDGSTKNNWYLRFQVEIGI
ncbi:porin [Flavobacterium sp. TSSA_36]|uniref:porin n=1 Tax=Flavobacterium sp. TSSA_36 TaxID=3447669 RepID=UPI003F2D80F9